MTDSFAFHVQRYFSSYLIAQRHYGVNTIASYRDTFRLMLKYLQEKPHRKTGFKISDVGYECCNSFLQWLEESRGNSVSTRNVRLAHLKSFFGYVYLQSPEYADICNKVLSIPFANVGRKPPESLTTDALTHLLHSVDIKKKEGLRHLAILALMYDSGCRVQELIGMRVCDVQFGNYHRVSVHGKGDKYREIPILPETADIIQKYIKLFHLEKTAVLFLNVKGEPLTRQGIRYIIRKYIAIAKSECPEEFKIEGYPHLLRHSKATHLIDAGVNIYNIRDFLGHESIVTTQVYLTSNPEVSRKVIEEAALKTVPLSGDFYTAKEKEDLMSFLETLC